MRRVRYYEFGEPDVLRVDEVEVPVPGPGEVLMRTEVIGTGFVDTSMRRGTSVLGQPPLPGSPHGDVVGMVEAVGEGVDAALIGERVVALVGTDAYADYVVAEAEWLARVPASTDAGTATVLAMPGPVALRALRTGQLAPGETVLVHSAAGGIGHLATQLAKLEGAGTVIATASSAEKLDFARKYGADVGSNYADADWPDQVRAAAPGGVDVILDSIGGQITATSMELLAPFGRLVIYGAASGEFPVIPVHGLYGLHSVAGFGILAFRTARPGQARDEMTEVSKYAAEGRLHTAVEATLPLSEAAKAHALLEDRARLGRVLLVP
jgi:NADPH:quinone reductase-like Zn-dependent oxidoreductase